MKERKIALAVLRERYIKKGAKEVATLLQAAESCKVSELIQLLKDCRDRLQKEIEAGNDNNTPAAVPEKPATENTESGAAEKDSNTESIPAQPNEVTKELCHMCMTKPAGLFCKGCSLQAYCSAACQKADWKRHKIDCVQLCPTCKTEKPTQRCIKCLLPYCGETCCASENHKKLCTLRIKVFEAYNLARSKSYEDLFSLIISVGTNDVFDALLDAGFITIINGICSERGALLDACAYNRLHMVQSLIERGATVAMINYEGHTPMHYACATDQDSNDLISYLMSKGATFTKSDVSQDAIPLHEACARGKKMAADLFLQDHPELKEARTKEGFTPFLCACEDGQFELAKHLIDIHHVDFRAVTNLGRNALHFAAINGSIESMQYLLGNGFDKDAKTNVNETPLFFACDAGQLEATRFLLNLKVDTTAIAANKATAFLMACSRGRVGIVKLFHEEFGQDIKTVRAWNKATPLHWAVASGNLELVTYLLERGAPLNLKDDENRTALALAKQSKFHAAIACIKKYAGK